MILRIKEWIKELIRSCRSRNLQTSYQRLLQGWVGSCKPSLRGQVGRLRTAMTLIVRG